jgi:STE24 endopeptidase
MAGELWWLYFGLAAAAAAVVLARLAPVVIFPLFYRFSRLEDGEIAERISGLLRSRNVGFEGIYSFNMSRDTKKANAGFAGMGRGKRIILSDTLVKEFTPGEIAVIFAHELGHYQLMHLWKGLGLTIGIILLSFYLCGQAYAATVAAMGFAGLHEIPAIPILILYLSVFGFLIMPATNAFSRAHEREADRYALEATGDAASFISSMERLADMNLSDRDPHPAVEFLFHGHPSIRKRIAFAEGWRGDRLTS